jgi:hypothetical protein
VINLTQFKNIEQEKKIPSPPNKKEQEGKEQEGKEQEGKKGNRNEMPQNSSSVGVGQRIRKYSMC